MNVKTKGVLIILVAVDLALVILSLTGYYILFLKPTGYVIPLAINIAVLAVIGFRSKQLHKVWIVVFLFISIPILLLEGFMVLLLDYDYVSTDSPHERQSLLVEYRHATLGETTYFYNFYKTNFGIIGKLLEDQTIEIMILGTEHPSGMGAKDILGIDREQWITKDIVRFPTWQGIKDVYLNPIESKVSHVEIEHFIEMVENKVNGETIIINGNRLTVSYDEPSGQSWIEVTGENGEGAIPRQQCSRIVPNTEMNYYMLEECTHQWEYPLYPITESR